MSFLSAILFLGFLLHFGLAIMPVGAAIDFSQPQASEHQPGGRGSHFNDKTKNAFLYPARNLPFIDRLDFEIGGSIFSKIWIGSPSTTTSSDGLGPLYNARSCLRCHVNGGRGQPPVPNSLNKNSTSMVLRLSIPPQTKIQQKWLDMGQLPNIAEPNYGYQLQNFAVTGMPAEGQIAVAYQTITKILADGIKVNLRQPQYTIVDARYGDLHNQLQISPRVAPPLIGLGLLDAITDHDLLSVEDTDDQNGDGISGRANRVWNQYAGDLDVGRFGWKAGNSSLIQQNSNALYQDIGIANDGAVFPAGDCTLTQLVCLNAPHGNTNRQDDLEASQQMTRALLYYTQNLAVPARTKAHQPSVLAGKRVFYKIGCNQCHRASYIVTDDPADATNKAPQIIWPYTDLLLHDMGPELADNRPEYLANGQEWRTPPLWGIGLTYKVSGHTYFLHDGRARNLLEAILWHGGEADATRQAVINLPTQDRENLIDFLESL